MAEVKVVATIEGTDYELNNNENLYSRKIVAPYNSTDVSVIATDESGNQSQESVHLYVNSEWLPPKVDWTADDYFNAKDYNRIVGNMFYLRGYLDSLFESITYIERMEDKTYQSLIYAREINAIEEELEILNNETYRFYMGEKKEYKANKATPLWSEFNRIESAMLLLHNTMIAHKEALPRLAFRLGGQKGIKG